MASCSSGVPNHCKCSVHHKNQHIVGTWEDDAFQLDIRHCSSSCPSNDPLSLPLFSDVLPYHCVPHCGVYGLSEYSLTSPLVLVMLSGKGLLDIKAPAQGLPQTMLDNIRSKVSTEAFLDVFFLVHSCPDLTVAVDPMARNVNIMFHLWALKDQQCRLASGGEIHVTMEMGGFSPVGVSEAPPICEEAEELNGLPLGYMGKRILHMHDNGLLSPNNAHLTLCAEHNLHSLFTLGCSDGNGEEQDGRAVLTLHLIPSNKVVESELREAAKSSSTLDKFVSCIERLDQTPGKLHFCACQGMFAACMHRHRHS